MGNNVLKLFQKKNEGDGGLSGKNQKAKPVKKDVERAMKLKKPEASKKPAKRPDEARAPWLSHLQQYLREVVYELRKVIWPSRKETVGSTAVVLVIVIVCGIYLGIVDALLSRFIRLVFG
ncbi:MAG: preprotein translocase subunit SecE [Syntrophobacteraceae bacterium]